MTIRTRRLAATLFALVMVFINGCLVPWTEASPAFADGRPLQPHAAGRMPITDQTRHIVLRSHAAASSVAVDAPLFAPRPAHLALSNR